MADDGLIAPDTVTMPLPQAHDLFQYLRRVEAAHPAAPRVGRASRVAHESVRLGQEPGLGFPVGALAHVAPAAGGQPLRVQVHCFGMLGPNGPLPLHLTEYVRQRVVHHGDAGLARFLDVFHHRMLSFFYRAWCESRPAVQHDRPDTDRFATYVGALFGLATPGLRERDALPDRSKLYYAGRFAAQVGHAEGLVALIADHFELPARIEEFVGEWAEIPADCQWRLGRARSPQRQVGSLGLGTHLGSRVWLRQGRFRLVLGPLTRAQFERVAPNGVDVPALVALVRGYVGDVLRWDVRLQLRRDAVPAFALGVTSYVGRATWLRSAALADSDDLIHEPMAAAHDNGSAH